MKTLGLKEAGDTSRKTQAFLLEGLEGYGNEIFLIGEHP